MVLNTFELVINRNGLLDGREIKQETSCPAEFGEIFRKEGICGILLELAALKKAQELSPTMIFWRDFASEALNKVCHTPENATQIDEIEPLSESQSAEYVLSVPAMTGAEYVAQSTFTLAWNDFAEFLRTAVDKAGSVAKFLNARASRWRQVGRVCFHLAENKGG